MKKIVLILFVFGKLCAYGQFSSESLVHFSLQPRVGVNDEKYIVGGLDNAFQFPHFEYALSLVMERYEACYFSLRVGYGITIGTNIQIMPLVARAYKYVSADKTEYTIGDNYWVWDYGLRFKRNIFFIQADYLEQFQFTIGAAIR